MDSLLDLRLVANLLREAVDPSRDARLEPAEDDVEGLALAYGEYGELKALLTADWKRVAGARELIDDELVDLAPAFDTWTRNLRSARKPLGEQKHTSRAGRASGGSVINQDKI